MRDGGTTVTDSNGFGVLLRAGDLIWGFPRWALDAYFVGSCVSRLERVSIWIFYSIEALKM